MFIWLKKFGRRVVTDMIKWIKRIIYTLMLSLYNTEKNMLSQETVNMTKGMNQRMDSETLAYALTNGVINQELRTLRWRMYKVLAASASIKMVPVTDKDGYLIKDEDGYISYTSEVINKAHELRKIKLDEYDNYPLEMVINNIPKPRSSHEDMDGSKILVSDKTTNDLIQGDIEGDTNSGVTTTTVVGEISSDELFTLLQSEVKIKVEREFPPKFNLEKYTKKLNIRTIDEDTRLLEFYVSKYPNEYDRRSDVFIKNVLKIDENPRVSSIIEFIGVAFETYNDTGVYDNKRYEYTNLTYDKTIEFDGHYVIKMKGTVVVNGEDLTEKYRMEDLDERYENKERREQNNSSSYAIQF